MINGSFAIMQINGKYLFLKRHDNGKWDLVGGGYDIHEVLHKVVVGREIKEEINLEIQPELLHLCATLGQRLKKSVSEKYGGIQFGTIYVYYVILYGEYTIVLDDEHTEYKLFSYEEIMENWKDFSSGPLWQFFTFLTFQEENELQDGMLWDRRTWKGKEYFTPN